MTKETEFVRIKRAVENEKTKKMQAEAKRESLENERARVMNEVSELVGRELKTSEEVSEYAQSLKDSIEENIVKMREILTEEDVSY